MKKRISSLTVALAERLCRPQRIGVFGHRGVGKTTLLTMLYREAVSGRLPELRLAAADAFGSLGLNRRTALWQVLRTGEDLPLFDGLDDDEDCPTLPELALGDQVIADYDTVGLSLKAHPMSFLRGALAAAAIRTA